MSDFYGSLGFAHMRMFLVTNMSPQSNQWELCMGLSIIQNAPSNILLISGSYYAPSMVAGMFSNRKLCNHISPQRLWISLLASRKRAILPPPTAFGQLGNQKSRVAAEGRRTTGMGNERKVVPFISRVPF